MGGLFKKPKVNTKQFEQQQAALEARNKALEADIERLKKPAPLPDETSETSRRSKMRAAAATAEQGGSAESTLLTGSRLGDASMAIARRGRVKSAVMTGGA
jgi:hypothetical protein